MSGAIPSHRSEVQSNWFLTTHWSVVQAAGHDSTPNARDALEKLCGSYWYPLYAYVRRKGHCDQDAKDLTQQFFARLLQGGRIALADPARGRFRTFLLTTLNHFLVNEWIKSNREKRGGSIEFVPLHTDDPENIYATEPADDRSPEIVYEQRWAATVMRRAFERLAARYGSERARLLEAFKPFLWGEKAGTSQAEIAKALGLSSSAVRVAIHRLRKNFREILRDEIAQTVARPEEVDDELRHLVEIVVHSPL
jgi:RNA polymerase sigma-70 factor (ECF subfamily)